MNNRVGQNLGNYQLTNLLGQGGFAEVYLGEHIYLKTQAAIKVLHTRLSHADDMSGFVKEAQTVARLVHPNIIRIFDFGVDQETPFLVMDYAPNGTLRHLHRRGQPLPLPTVVSYVKQVAEALQYAHNEKLIHRDVKPENMLVGRHNEILLSDFGIALVAQSSRYQSTQDVVGTAAYMSPEQIQGKPRPASDQYSLAIVVYEWLSGTPPFSGSFTELCTQHMFATVPPLRARVPGMMPEVEQVINMALAKNPKERFASIQAFANALAQASGSSLSRPLRDTSSGAQPTLLPVSALPLTSQPISSPSSTPQPAPAAQIALTEAVRGAPPRTQEQQQRLPAWLRAEIVGPLPPSPVPRPSLETPVKEAKQVQSDEVAQLRNELARHRREMARYRQQISALSQKARPEGRGGCLTAWLVVQMVALAVSVLSSCFLIQSIGPGGFVLMCIGAALGGASIYGLWHLRKWGYYMQMTLASIALVVALISISTTSSFPEHIFLFTGIGEAAGACLAMGLLYWMAHERWEVFE